MLPEGDSLRRYDAADRLIAHLDHALGNVFRRHPSRRPYPAEGRGEGLRSAGERRLAAGLMRVNHAGEIAAQALYHGQGITARDPELRRRLFQASVEESDHLNWCRRRLDELGARPSRLDPFWYLGSLAIGVAAGIAGDRWNLGFLSETERQVVRHLEGHLARLPRADARSRAIVEQMREDELGHAELAESLGAARLPAPVRRLMRLASKVMTTVAERI